MVNSDFFNQFYLNYFSFIIYMLKQVKQDVLNAFSSQNFEQLRKIIIYLIVPEKTRFIKIDDV